MSAHSRPKRRGRRALRVLWLTSLCLFGSAGVVLATWAATGSGNGSDQALTAQTVTVTVSASPTADLYPGGSGALQFQVNNPNPYAISFTSVTYGSVTSSSPSGCPASNVTAAAGGTLGSAINVAANATAATESIPAALSMSTSAPDACQGVTFTVPITLSGAQS